MDGLIIIHQHEGNKAGDLDAKPWPPHTTQMMNQPAAIFEMWGDNVTPFLIHITKSWTNAAGVTTLWQMTNGKVLDTHDISLLSSLATGLTVIHSCRHRLRHLVTQCSLAVTCWPETDILLIVAKLQGKPVKWRIVNTMYDLSPALQWLQAIVV